MRFMHASAESNRHTEACAGGGQSILALRSLLSALILFTLRSKSAARGTEDARAAADRHREANGAGHTFAESKSVLTWLARAPNQEDRGRNVIRLSDPATVPTVQTSTDHHRIDAKVVCHRCDHIDRALPHCWRERHNRTTQRSPRAIRSKSLYTCAHGANSSQGSGGPAI